MFRIAQFSDLHCGETYFEASLLERAIGEINEFEPDVVVCSGDLTTFGFRHEYLTAREYLDRIDCDAVVVVPGNHDSRNVGYVHFEEMFGERNSVLRKGPVAILVRLWAQFSPFTAVSEAEQQGRAGGRLAFTGSVQAIVDDIGHFQERGLQHCVIGGDGKDLQGTLELLEQFTSEVMAKCD